MKLKHLLVPVALLAAMAMSACITVPGDDPPGSDENNTPEATTGTTPTTTTGTAESTVASSDELEVSIEGELTVGATVTVVVTMPDGSPAADSTVTVNGVEAGTTDSEGRIEITVPEDSETITITARSGTVEVVVEQRVTVTQQTRLKVYVQGQANPGAEATIVVRTPEGTAAEGAEVTVNNESIGVTGPDGKIKVMVPGNSDRLIIMVKFGDMEAKTQKLVTEPHLEVTVDTKVTVESTTTVTVRRPDGSAAEGADVTVNGESAGTTDEKGQLVINVDVNVDVLVIEVRTEDLEGSVEADIGAEPTPEATTAPTPMGTPGIEPTETVNETLQIALSADLTQGAVITLTVTDSEGNPVKGATVSLNGETLGTTDANGQMHFEVPTVLELRFEAYAGGSMGTLFIDLDG